MDEQTGSRSVIRSVGRTDGRTVVGRIERGCGGGGVYEWW